MKRIVLLTTSVLFLCAAAPQSRNVNDLLNEPAFVEQNDMESFLQLALADFSKTLELLRTRAVGHPKLLAFVNRIAPQYYWDAVSFNPYKKPTTNAIIDRVYQEKAKLLFTPLPANLD